MKLGLQGSEKKLDGKLKQLILSQGSLKKCLSLQPKMCNCALVQYLSKGRFI